MAFPGLHPEVSVDHTILINNKKSTLWETKYLSFFLEIFIKLVNASRFMDMVKIQTDIHNLILCLGSPISLEILFHAFFSLSNVTWTILQHYD